MGRKLPLIVLFLAFLCFSFFVFWRVVIQPSKISSQSEYETQIVSINDTKINVMLADTPAKQMLGLGKRKTLADNQGMLFPYPRKVTPYFWMKDMAFSIDIIWISDTKIVGIEKNVDPPTINTPDSELTRYAPQEPINFVLEVNSGFSDKNNIKIGDEIVIANSKQDVSF